MKQVVALLTLLALIFGTVPAVAVEPEEGPVRDTWARTDLPVKDGVVSRTWMWGPEALSGPMIEPYEETPGGSRPVQYFDKARMEITHPDGDPESIWYVTNGLLVVEMITGNVQVGDAGFVAREPAQINVAGDPDVAGGITYALLAEHLDSGPWGDGTIFDGQIHPDGTITVEPELAEFGIYNATFDLVTNHSIAWPFFDFMTAQGTVFENGRFVTDDLFENLYFATGRPITEPYWAEVQVAGTVKWVLIQAFERRILTFTPDNPEGWQVEAGNVGRHYFEWRYADDPEAPSEPEPEPTPGRSIEIDVEGIEVDFGDTVGDTTFGLRFIGAATGDVEGAIEVSLDYSPPNPGPNVVNVIVGGSWSITSPVGAVGGEITGGSATWDEDVSEAAVEATFAISEATGEFSGYAGQGAFTGTLSHLSFPPRIGGTLVFTLE